ncbi:MAG: hypothetical protein ACLQMT_02595 [Candidatus Acidiferrales bacterium]
MSRIWEAIKRAERQRSRASLAARAENLAPCAPDRRKILRYAYFMPVLVYGSDVDKQPFHEQVETIDANKNGCLLALDSIVARGQRLFLINMRNQAEQECRVAHVGERAQGRARVGIEFLHPASYFWRAL